MFKERMSKEATPERVYELCRIVDSFSNTNNVGVSADKVREIIEPQSASSSTPYFPSIKKAAMELGLLDGDSSLFFVGEKKVLEDYDKFRRYCNSKLFNDKSWDIFKLCRCFMRLNDSWLKTGAITSSESVDLISKTIPEFQYLDLQKTYVPACRFWLSFLGYGYIQESAKILFLPNAYIALKDFISMVSLEKNKEYSIGEFFELMPKGFSVLFDRDDKTTDINYALSNGLMQLNDSKEIELRRNPDSETVWSFFSNDNTYTHLVYKGVK